MDHHKAEDGDAAGDERAIGIADLVEVVDDRTHNIGKGHTADEREYLLFRRERAAIVLCHEAHHPGHLRRLDHVMKQRADDKGNDQEKGLDACGKLNDRDEIDKGE